MTSLLVPLASNDFVIPRPSGSRRLFNLAAERATAHSHFNCPLYLVARDGATSTT